MTASPSMRTRSSALLEHAGAALPGWRASTSSGAIADLGAAVDRLGDAVAHELRKSGRPGFDVSQCTAAICARVSPTRLSPDFSAWSRKVNSWSRASVASQSDSLARSTAMRVLVDAVEAALRDQAAGVQLLVLVGRDRRAAVPGGAPRP